MKVFGTPFTLTLTAHEVITLAEMLEYIIALDIRTPFPSLEPFHSVWVKTRALVETIPAEAVAA